MVGGSASATAPQAGQTRRSRHAGSPGRSSSSGPGAAGRMGRAGPAGGPPPVMSPPASPGHEGAAQYDAPRRHTGSMSRAHDIGGQTGFGPVPQGQEGQPFAADWEARVYALNTVLRRRGLYGTDQMRDAIEQIPPE